MRQNVNEENEQEIEYEHNQEGALPATFHDVEDVNLRIFNRGAVLANIFEQHVDEKTGKILPRDLGMCLREVTTYLNLIPANEREDAHAAMFVHLEDRGYMERANGS